MSSLVKLSDNTEEKIGRLYLVDNYTVDAPNICYSKIIFASTIYILRHNWHHASVNEGLPHQLQVGKRVHVQHLVQLVGWSDLHVDVSLNIYDLVRLLL